MWVGGYPKACKETPLYKNIFFSMRKFRKNKKYLVFFEKLPGVQTFLFFFTKTSLICSFSKPFFNFCKTSMKVVFFCSFYCKIQTFFLFNFVHFFLKKKTFFLLNLGKRTKRENLICAQATKSQGNYFFFGMLIYEEGLANCLALRFCSNASNKKIL